MSITPMSPTSISRPIRSAFRIAAAGGASLALILGGASGAHAVDYGDWGPGDPNDPVSSGCVADAQTVAWNSVFDATTYAGTVSVRYSPNCNQFWGRLQLVPGLQLATVSVRVVSVEVCAEHVPIITNSQMIWGGPDGTLLPASDLVYYTEMINAGFCQPDPIIRVLATVGTDGYDYEGTPLTDGDDYPYAAWGRGSNNYPSWQNNEASTDPRDIENWAAPADQAPPLPGN